MSFAPAFPPPYPSPLHTRCRLLLRQSAAALLGAGLLLFHGRASAHIELTKPLARYDITGADTGIKGCPCGIATGGGNSNRTCNVQLDGSDPNRNEQRVVTAPAGSTLVLEFKETIGHVGKYRVAFDDEGADFDDFNSHVLAEMDDPQGNTGNVGAGNAWTMEVTLPETPCTSCTLQLTQVMDASVYQKENVDWSKLASLSTYYSCIDLVLTGDAPTTGGDGETSVTSEPSSTTEFSTEFETSESASTSSTSVSSSVTTSAAPSTTTSAPTPTTPSAPSAPVANPATSPADVPSPPAPTGGEPGATSTAPMPAGSEEPAEDAGGGCALRSPSKQDGAWALLGLGAALFARRRRR